MGIEQQGLPRPAVSEYKNVGHETTTTSDETILSKPTDGTLGVIEVIAYAPSGLTSPAATLKDGAVTIGVFSVSSGDTEILIENSIGLEINNDLVIQTSASGVIVSAWAVLA
jgi:hypothetical protein